jgi:hypothetical protein
MASSTLNAVRLYRMDLPDHACPRGLRGLPQDTSDRGPAA